MANEKFKETVEFFADHYGWECIEEQDKNRLLMYSKYTDGTKVRINVFYGTRTVVVMPKRQKTLPSYKKCSDKEVENIFHSPLKSPYEQKSLPVATEPKSSEKKMIPVLELIDRIKQLEKRVEDLEEALRDKSIPPL